jgi:hypothetical protein
MPEISRFFGIVIRMFVEAGGQHHTPHFHAYYQEHIGIYDIIRIERLAGSLPRRQERLVLAWARATSARVDGQLGNVARRPASY